MLRRIAALGPWLAEGKYVWTTLAVVAVALLVCFQSGASEPWIRLTGLGLQVLGVTTALWGISETRRFFGRPSPIAQLLQWIARCPLRRRAITLRIDGSTIHTTVGRMRVHVTTPIDETSAHDIQLRALEKNIAQLHDRITAVARDLDAEVAAVRRDIQKESKDRDRVSAQLHDRLEGVATGGIHITAIGAAWLFVGVILSTAAPELSSLMK